MALNIPNSAGYGGLVNTPLVRPGYHDTFMVPVYERDFLREITNSAITERIISCAQQIQIMKAPMVGPWRPYVIDQEMVASQVTSDAICLSICNAAYQAIKFDTLTIHWACDLFDKYEPLIMEAVYESFVADQRKFVFASMIAGASKRNQGNSAGQHGNIKLGAPGNPRVITKSSLVAEMAKLQLILSEHLYNVEKDLFLVVPLQMRPVFVQTNYANMAYIGGSGRSTIIDGSWGEPIMGFNIFQTSYLPSIVDNGKVCFFVIAGHKTAYAYASDIINSRIVEGTATWSIEYQMLAVWGGAPLYPEYLAVAYWTFDPEVA